MYWLISTNPKKFDCARAFFDYGFIDWKQNCNYFIGDTGLPRAEDMSGLD